MEHHQAGMARKWERHFNETKTTISYALILFGICFAVPLVFIYPQRFSSFIFDSRLAFHLILEVEDYFTCSRDFKTFVIDEPQPNEALYKFYLFNVSNAMDVLQRGYKPTIQEIGPYGYKKSTYKYDVSFDPEHSEYVSFKEYVILKAVDNQQYCSNMFFRMDAAYNLLSDPCANGECDCRNDDEIVVTINPLFQKLLWKESSHEFLARYSSDVYNTIRQLLENDFVTAVKMHLVSNSIQEVYFFRQQMQIGHLLSAAVSNFTATRTLNETATMMETKHSTFPKRCGLDVYSVYACPMYMYDYINLAKDQQRKEIGYSDFAESNFPTVYHLLLEQNPFSILNLTVGLPQWVGLGYCLGYTTFNAGKGYTMIRKETDCAKIFNNVATLYAKAHFGTTTPTTNQLLGSQAMVRGVANFLVKALISPYSATVLTSMTYDEFRYTFQPVACSPYGIKCVWQWGYMKKYHRTTEAISDAMAYKMINFGSRGDTNPINFYFDGNAGAFYNAYRYCEIVYPDPSNYNTCLEIEYTFPDATVNLPAGYWGVNSDISAINRTNLYLHFKRVDSSVKARYTSFSCNVSSLLYEVFPSITGFHDEFVIRYINDNKDANLNHNFTVGKWEELGWAQFAGGFITKAVAGVRSLYQVKRNGMWYIGQSNYINGLLEFSSWGLKTAFPQTWFYNLTEARILLDALSRTDQAGVDFKKHIVFAASTFIGDGVHLQNNVGAVGEMTFVNEANRGNFSCGGEMREACGLLSIVYNSSAASCDFVQSVYDACLQQIYTQNAWVTNCNRFETALTSTTTGIQCDHTIVFGHNHPYAKSRGNVLYEMLLELTLSVKLKEGLWCSDADNCDFNWGGLFTTSTVRNVLFEGFSDPSVLKFLSIKLAERGISFSCTANSLDACGTENYRCNYLGITMNLPGGSTKLLRYGITPNDELFAPYFEVVASTGEMLWRYSMNKTLAAISVARADAEEVVFVHNPIWAAHPAWHSDDIDFIKFIQCQKRIFGGLPGLFNSCEDTLNTGKVHLNETLNIVRLHGNDSMYYFEKPHQVRGSTERNQYPMYLWSGFRAYAFTYFAGGGNQYKQKDLTVFDKQHGFHFTLSQSDFTFPFEKQMTLMFPITDTYTRRNFSSSRPIYIRRFVEDAASWTPLKSLGTPKDSYGMPYSIPIGMASLERRADFPVFLSTAHCYGNEAWGGVEYSHVIGYEPNKYAQRTFVDYDAVTGKAMRQALRHQVMVRIERGPVVPNIISSQLRCVVPTKSYSANSGYGCFAYVPLYWAEDSRVENTEQFYRDYDHFYSRPDRAAVLINVGLVVGFVFMLMGSCLYLYEQYQRRKFSRRVYID